MPIKNIVKNTWKLVSVMKNDELKLANEETKSHTETNDLVSKPGMDSPKWFSNISSIIKLFHELFLAIKTGILPVLLFCFLFIPSAISSGVGTITTGINNVLDKLADNHQSASVTSTGVSITQQFTKPQEKIITDTLIDNGETPQF